MIFSFIGNVWKNHRLAAILGAGVGVAILAGLVAYETAMTPARPVIQTAAASEVVAYIGNARGLAALPDVEQHQFLQQWKDHLADAQRRAELKACFERLAPDERRQFTESIFRHVKKAFMADARQFARMSDLTAKNRFIRDRLTVYRDDALFFREIGGAFKADLPAGHDAIQQWLLEHTTAEERLVAEPYADALKRIGEQVKKEGRLSSAAQAASQGQRP